MSVSVWLALLLAGAALPAPAAVEEHFGDRWVEIAPPSRAGHASVYDAQRRRLIIVGGEVAGAPRNDVWVLSLSGPPRWELVEPAGDPPSPRSGAAAAYDSTHDRLLLFGGRDTSGRALGDLWELSLDGRARWRRVATAGPAPTPRWQSTLTPDPEDGALVLYGGASAYFRRQGDAWRLSLPRLEWTPMTPTGTPPLARSGHSAVYCPELHGIVVFGGNVVGPLPDNPSAYLPHATAEAWLLSSGKNPVWNLLKAPSADGPCEMEGQVAAWDGAEHRMLVFGGAGSLWTWRTCKAGYDAVWTLSVPDLQWSRAWPVRPWPRPRSFAAACFDAETRCLYVHGGLGRLEGGACYADAWRLALDPEPAWVRLAPARDGPPFSGYSRPAAMDLEGNRIVLDSGNQIWTYDVRHADWSPVAASGETPPAHSGNIAVLDTKRDRLVIYGGRLGYPTLLPFQQVWALTLGNDPRWTRLPTRGQLPAAIFDAAVYDPVRDRLLIHASSHSAPQGGGVWALPFETAGTPEWEQISSPLDTVHVRTPSPEAAVAAYDSKRDRMVIFGGGTLTPDWGWPTNGCWALTLSGPPVWHELSPSQSYYNRDPAHPSPRYFPSGVYDAANDRLIVVGGTTSGLHHIPDDAWALSLDSNRWTQLRMGTDPHPGWLRAAAVYDPRRGRTLVLQDDIIWALESGRESWPPTPRARETAGTIPTPAAAVLQLHGVLPNPSAGEMQARITLPDAAPAALELLDLAGRRLWRDDVGPLGAGIHLVRVSPARVMPPGLYLLRLTHGTASITSKVIRLRE
jgi:hypothetical protein